MHWGVPQRQCKQAELTVGNPLENGRVGALAASPARLDRQRDLAIAGSQQTKVPPTSLCCSPPLPVISLCTGLRSHLHPCGTPPLLLSTPRSTVAGTVVCTCLHPFSLAPALPLLMSPPLMFPHLISSSPLGSAILVCPPSPHAPHHCHNPMPVRRFGEWTSKLAAPAFDRAGETDSTAAQASSTVGCAGRSALSLKPVRPMATATGAVSRESML